jgi:hypothetical protein
MQIPCGCQGGWVYEDSTLSGVIIGRPRKVRCTRPGCNGGWITVPDSYELRDSHATIQHRKDDRW